MDIAGIDVQHPCNGGYKKLIGRYSGRQKKRYWELDFLRGICVVLMVFDHFMYCIWDVVPMINDVLGTTFLSTSRMSALRYWNWSVRNNVRELVILCFLMLCGVSCTLTRGNLRRAVPLILVAALLSAVTSALDTLLDGGGDIVIVFGVIHMIAAGILLYAVFDNAAVAIGDALFAGKPRAKLYLRLLPAAFGVLYLILYFALWGDLYIGSSRFNFLATVSPPAGISKDEFIFKSVFIQFSGRDMTRYYGGDYFPLLPYAAFILLGGAIGVLVYHTSARHSFTALDGDWNRPVCFIGRHAAVIYLAHMAVIPAILALLALISSIF